MRSVPPPPRHPLGVVTSALTQAFARADHRCFIRSSKLVDVTPVRASATTRCRPVHVEALTFGDHYPSDPGELVGQGDDGLVVAAPGLDLLYPLAQRIISPVSSADGGAAPVDHHGA